MSVFTSLGILILATLIMATLQFVPSIFLIFYHYASGKYSNKKASDFTLSFALGVEFFSTVMFLLLYAVFFAFFYNHPYAESNLFLWIMGGIFIALSIISCFFYYRKKTRGTELFVPRSMSRSIFERAKGVKNKKEAFLLGCFSGTIELVFSFPIYIIAVAAAHRIDCAPRSLLVILFVLSPLIPIVTNYLMFRTGLNLAEIERRRIKSKQFQRFMLVLGYALLVFAIAFSGVIK